MHSSSSSLFRIILIFIFDFILCITCDPTQQPLPLSPISIANCQFLSPSGAVCLRCESGYILLSNSCVINNIDQHPNLKNCLERTLFLDCVRCECGYSFEDGTTQEGCTPTPVDLNNPTFVSETTKVIQTITLTGCQIFRAYPDLICLRPKPEYQLVYSQQGAFLTVSFSNYSHCEIILEDGTCVRCHAGYQEEKNRCIEATNQIENVFYSYFSNGILLSRDMAFIAIENHGVYPVISECSEYIFNRTLNRIECKKCYSGRAPTESATVCAKKPFEACAIAYDNFKNDTISSYHHPSTSQDNFRCKSCLYPDIFYMQMNQNCKKRSMRYRYLINDLCKIYSPTSKTHCIQCHDPFVLASYECVFPAYFYLFELYKTKEQFELSVEEILQFKILDTKKNSRNQLENCYYAIDSKACLECDMGYILDESNACQLSIIDSCILLDIRGNCIKCKVKWHLIDGKCIQNEDINCFIFDSELGCQRCFDGFYLVALDKPNNQTCIATGLLCDYSNGVDQACIQCENRYYLKKQFKQQQSAQCISISQSETCYTSDGKNDECITCRRHFIAIDGICYSRIPFLNGNCAKSGSYFPYTNQVDNNNKDQKYCELHTFWNKDKCRIFDKYKNTCLKCERGWYILEDDGRISKEEIGRCEYFQGCKVTDGISKRCYLANLKTDYLDPETSLVKNFTGCQTNQRDSFCVMCMTDKEEAGLLLNNYVTCVEQSRVHVEILPNCILLSKFEEGGEGSSFECAQCMNRYYLSDSRFDSEGLQLIGRHCLAISDDQSCELSDGIHDQCLVCYDVQSIVKQRHDSIYKLFLEPGEQCNTILTGNLNLEIPFCEKMVNNQCVQCWSLFTLVGNSCEPIDTINCLKSDGVHNICEQCEFFDKMKGITIDCQIIYCVIYNENYSTCLKCANGFRLINVQNTEISICISENEKTCVEISENGECTRCLLGYMFKAVGLIRFACQKITEPPNCLQKTQILSQHRTDYQCTLCDDTTTFLSPRSTCLPKNNRCEVMRGIKCEKCKQEFAMTEFNTCEEIANCVFIHENICIHCESGFYLSKERDQTGNIISTSCIRINNCLQSEGVKQICMMCENGYTLMSSKCVNLNSIPNCEYYELIEEVLKCVRCRGLFYLKDSEGEGGNSNPDNKRIKKQQCVEITAAVHCRFSFGIEDKCEFCEIHGYALSDAKKCELINNCIFSDGISTCFQCEKNYFANISIGNRKNALNQQSKQQEQEDLSEEQRTLNKRFEDQCKTRIIIRNCDVYLMYGEGCVRCENFFYLSENGMKCTLIDKEYSFNCLQSNGVSQSCELCKDGFAFELIQSKLTGKCTRKKVQYEKKFCQTINLEQKCSECIQGFYYDSQNEICLPQIVKDNCEEYDPAKDTCIVCKNGYKLIKLDDSNPKDSKKQLLENNGYCAPLEEYEKVYNCAVYAANQNICIKCSEKPSQIIITFWLDKRTNSCVDVSEFRCQEMHADRMECIEGKTKHIPFCEFEMKVNNQKGSSSGESSGIDVNQYSCGICENGLYLDEGKCIEQPFIPFCEIYSSKKGFCDQCISNYYYDVSHGCVEHKIKHCKHYQSGSNICRGCEQGYSLVGPGLINMTNCILSAFNNCKSVVISNYGEQLHCSNCDQHYVWNSSTNSCVPQAQKQQHCKLFKNNNTCEVCDEGYLLNHQLECISLSSNCAVPQCIEYANSSHTEQLVCSKCAGSYVLDNSNQNFQCLLSEVKLVNDDNKSKDNQTKGESSDSKQKNDNDNQSIGQTILILVIVVAVISVLAVAGYVVMKYLQKIRNEKMTGSSDTEMIVNPQADQVNNISLSDLNMNFQESL